MAELDGIPPHIEWRVIDSNTGTEVIGQLSHPHQSSGSVRALLPGHPGARGLGEVTIPLHPSGSDEFELARADYDQLAIGQKLEGYEGAISGSPRYSYVITDLPRSLGGGWTIKGVDTLLWLERSKMLPGEVISAPDGGVLPTTGIGVITVFRATEEILWDDDFTGYLGGSGPHPSSDYTASNWSGTASDPYMALPGVQSTTAFPTEAYITTTSTWTSNTHHLWSEVQILGTIKMGTDTTTSGGVGIFILCDSNIQNGILGQVLFAYDSGTSLHAARLEIFDRTAGTYTSHISKTSVFTAVASPWPFDLRLVTYYAMGHTSCRMILNGDDPDCVFDIEGIIPLNSGRIGMRHSPASTGSPAVYVNRLRLLSRPRNWGTPRFALGSTASGSGDIQQVLPTNGQSHLDVMMQFASSDGFLIRKNAARGYKADSLDYAASPGTASGVVFRHPGNVVDASIAAADTYSTDVVMNSLPGADGGGQVTWSTLGTTGDQVLKDQQQDVSTSIFRLLVKWAQLVSARKADPLRAIELKVNRTADIVGRFRELDFVTVDIPKLGLFEVSAMVAGYTFDESSPVMTVWLNEWPLGQAALRLTKPLDYLTSTFKPR